MQLPSFLSPERCPRCSIFFIAAATATVAVGWSIGVELLIYRGQAWFFDGWRIAAEACVIFIVTGGMSMWLAYRVRQERAHFERELTRMNAHLQELVVTDGLTGTHNRRYLQMKLRQEWLRMERFGHTLACVMLDIDDFKKLNDTYGHQAGDVVLRGVADILYRELRAVDVICRYGGEEFVVIMLEKPSHKLGLQKAMDRLRDGIAAARFRVDGKTLRVTASFGGAIAPDPRITSPDELVHLADEAMYAAKHAGKHCCRVWGVKTPRASQPAKVG